MINRINNALLVMSINISLTTFLTALGVEKFCANFWNDLMKV